MKTLEILNRWKWRLLLPIGLFALAMAVVQPLTELTGVPELPRVLPAIAVLYVCEMAVSISRAIFNPKIDFQELTVHASTTPDGAAKIAALYAWRHRIYVVLLTCVIYWS